MALITQGGCKCHLAETNAHVLELTSLGKPYVRLTLALTTIALYQLNEQYLYLYQNNY